MGVFPYGLEPFSTPGSTASQQCSNAVVTVRIPYVIILGVCNPIFVADKASQNLREFIGDSSNTSPILKEFFEVFPETFTLEEKIALRHQAEKIMTDEVIPAFKRLLDFVMTRYITRENIAITSLPNGRQLYAQMIKFHTDSDADPTEIHENGLNEVQRLERLMTEVVKEMDHDMTLQQFTERLRADPAQQFATVEELLSDYGRLVHQVTTPAARKLFNSLPCTPLHILVKPDSYYTIYEPGNLDGSRPGTFNVGARNLTMHAKFKMLTLALHEGIPGHHLQLSAARESRAMPLFRSFRATCSYCHMPSGFPKRACFVEGWGMYAEFLGFELGLFDNVLDRFGHYSEEIFRACRLVVDTGIHAMGWSRELAIQYLLDHSSTTRASAETEIDRYITCPGQALAYKWGQLKLIAMRARAEASLGDKFNIKDFHDVVLNSFGPISLLEDEIEKFIRMTET
ncbi:Protein of unknown function DUF885 [Trinorchestia longiramus]|nr:Protein of unknown function DUF885 [Trinorchestia longiramus]